MPKMPKPPGPARAPLSIPLSKQYRQCNVPGCTKRNLGRGKCGPGRGCRPTEAACSLGCGRILKGRRKCDAGKGCRATDAKGSHGSSEELVELCEATLRTAKRKTGRTPPGMYKASAKQLSPRPALPPMKKKRKPRAGMKLRALQKEAEVRSTLVLIVPPCLDWIGSRLVHTHEPTILMSRPRSVCFSESTKWRAARTSCEAPRTWRRAPACRRRSTASTWPSTASTTARS